MTALVTMSRRELDRASVLAQLAEGRVSQVQAAELLGLGVRQVRRLSRAYAADGPAVLASKRRGRRSNRALADDVREAAIALVRARYADFGPTLAHEKLVELHGFAMSVTTLRQGTRMRARACSSVGRASLGTAKARGECATGSI